MPDTTEQISTQAIKAALESRWKEAIALNKELLNFDDQNIPALNRLAKAYLELGKFDDAKRTLKLVLKIDPINPTAKRNLDLALAHKKATGTMASSSIKNFIKEPGTTKEFTFSVMTKGLTAKKFYLGEALTIDKQGHKVSLLKADNELIGIFDTNNAEKILSCGRRGGTVTASFLHGEEKEITVLVKSSVPIFKSEKQEVKPYIKRDTIEEPELESSIPENEEIG